MCTHVLVFENCICHNEMCVHVAVKNQGLHNQTEAHQSPVVSNYIFSKIDVVWVLIFTFPNTYCS